MNHLENLTVLRDFIANTCKLDLAFYTSECGTLHCTAGWLPHIEHFQKLGVLAGIAGEPTMEGYSIHSISSVCNLLFGMFNASRSLCDEEGTWWLLFSIYGASGWDEELGAYDANGMRLMSDKDLALARLDRAIQIRETEAAIDSWVAPLTTGDIT